MNKPQSTAGQRPQLIQIADDRAGQRIDNFLLASLRGVPKSRIYSMLRKGEVRVNKGRVKANYRLRPGDTLRLPPVRQSEPPAAETPGSRVLGLIDASILLEDKNLLVINKPSGLAVHGGSGLSYGVIEALRALRPAAACLELAHRLDRDTSGCLIIAKKRSALRQVHALLRGEGGALEKRYLALVKGRWSGGARAVDVPLRKNTLRSGERVVSVSDEGKAARSLFTPVRVFADCSLVEILLQTGRTHQIRVHAAAVGHPLAGDEKYGDAEFNRRMKQRGLKRLFLHALSLQFALPVGEVDDVEDYAVSAPLPPELEQVLSSLEAGACTRSAGTGGE